MINIVVPMAGLGSRFSATGRLTPKPLIDVEPGRPMIGYVVEFLTLKEPGRLVFVCQSEHDRLHALGATLRKLAPSCEIVFVDDLPRGPAASALLAAPQIDDDDELLIAYCDGFLSFELGDFLAAVRGRAADGGLMIYPSSSPFDSYAAVDEDGNVLRTAEKQAISPHGTAGFYYFRRGRDFVAAARAMIEAGASGAGEFFVCPVFNEMIRRGQTIAAHPIAREQQIEMGTPEDLRLCREWLAARRPPRERRAQRRRS